ncbi:glutathione S-transferase family protein [Tropicimonas sp. IMCC6043]|uniref:glutathione S-transferase family protein n=1 Tax=Tropicimonas sp. IMCC6043 TaxID=2510645 RepID=UPI00101D1216|nr:glutathione S-transferase family protein [Tropicimonas sp. IMCC6043]RYH11365.1 glutathione S-transferase family protein [Tropicimonas sp. IMCC6043]
MKLHMHPASITSRPVRLFMADKGIEAEEVVVDLMTGAHHQDPFMSFNPNRLVPVLEDGDLKLTESSAILKYLADKYDLPEYPKDLKARARVNEMMDWVNTNFYRDWGYNLCYPQLFPHHQRPSAEGQEVTVRWGSEKSKFWLQVLNDYWLGDGREWLTGDEITIADYFAGSVVALGDMIRYDFSAYPNVSAWLARVKALPNWKPVSEALDGFAGSLSEKEFISA